MIWAELISKKCPIFWLALPWFGQIIFLEIPLTSLTAHAPKRPSVSLTVSQEQVEVWRSVCTQFPRAVLFGDPASRARN